MPSRAALLDRHATLGQIAFEAHCANGGGQHIYGKTITDWNALSPMAQEAWYQAALVVIETVWKDSQKRKIASENVELARIYT